VQRAANPRATAEKPKTPKNYFEEYALKHAKTPTLRPSSKTLQNPDIHQPKQRGVRA